MIKEMINWQYRVIDDQIIDSDTGRVLSLEQVTKLLNDVPSVQQQCKDAQDSLNKAMDKLSEVELEERPGDNCVLVTEAIALLEDALFPLDNLGWGRHER